MLIATSPYGRHPADPGPHRSPSWSPACPSAFLLSLLLPGPAWVAAAWLGPALAMIPVLMAIASFIGPRPAAAVVAVIWSGLILGATRRLPATWPIEAQQQAVFVLLAVAACVVLLVRSRSTHPMGDAL